MLYDRFMMALALGSLEQAERDHAADLAITGINLSPGPKAGAHCFLDPASALGAFPLSRF